MTHDEAVKELNSYKNSVQGLFIFVALETVKFTRVGAEIEDALGIPSGLLALTLADLKITDMFSAYLSALENAAKGQLVPVEDEWADTIGGE